MRKKTLISGTLVVFFLWQCSTVLAQIKNNGNLYVHELAELYIGGTNAYDFSATAVTQTARNNTNFGVISFGDNTLANAAFNTHYVNGYVKTYGTTFFIAPVGDDGVYAPARVLPSTPAGVAVAYVRSSGSGLSTTLASSLQQISATEYWIIKGVPATISLSWRSSSALANILLTPNIDYITLVGFNGTDWVPIPSSVDIASFLGGSSSLTAGSITSDASVILSDFAAFAIGAKKELPCYPVIVSSEQTKTWNGSTWSPSAPTLADPVIINGSYTGNLAAFSVALNADVTLADDNHMEVATGFTGIGKVIMASNASLLQRDGTSVAPQVVITKQTRPMRRYDYVFLSNPINNATTFFEQILNKNNAAVAGNFGAQNLSAFEQLRTFNDAGLQPIDATDQNTPIGRGFSATVRSQAPYATSNIAGAWNDDKRIMHLKTEGTANNGSVSVNVPANGWVRIGNPYPSPINGIRLLDAMGSNVWQTLYYWTFNNPRGSLAANSYNNADFATFNRAGGTAACSGCEVPTGVIATMQSVLASSSVAGTFEMTNCLRDLSGNTNFYKAANDEVRGKFRLNLVGNHNSFSQILVSYDDENGTLSYDNGFDSQRLSGTSSEISSVIGTARYAIQTRPGFTLSDVVPLLLDKRTSETFTLSIATVEGVFETTPIYLHDKTLGSYHDLTSSSYTFVQDEDNSTRFDVVYQIPLAATDFQGVGAFAYIHKDVFTAQSQMGINHIVLYDLAGRVVQEFKNVSGTSFTSPFQYAQGVYVAKINLDTGKVITQKLIHQ